MFKEIDLYEAVNKDVDVANEAEYGGYLDKDKRIRLSTILEWLDKVNGSGNASYLKCIVGSSKNGPQVNSIVGITYSEDLIYKKDIEVPHAVQIAFKEDNSGAAIAIADVVAQLQAIAAKCEEEGVALEDVDVFCMNEKNKLTQFAFYYDDATDTAVIVKNMNAKAASKFLNGEGGEAVQAAAKTPKTSNAQLDAIIAELSTSQDDEEFPDVFNEKADDGASTDED